MSQGQIGQESAGAALNRTAGPSTEKHVNLFDQMQRVEGIKERIIGLLARIHRQDTAGKKPMDVEPPCLAQLLNEGPESLSEQITEIHALLDNITDSLF